MKVTRDTVLNWLETSPDRSRDRAWLAKQCDVGVAAISNWLREKNPRDIPPKAAIIIGGLMAADEAARLARERTPQNLVLEFTDEEFSLIESAASKMGDPLRQWCKDRLAEAAEMDIAAIARRHAAQVFAKAADGGLESPAAPYQNPVTYPSKKSSRKGKPDIGGIKVMPECDAEQSSSRSGHA